MGKDGFIGELEQMLLLGVLRLEDEAYGMRLMEELEERAGRRVSRGSVYVTLDRMEDKGWIVSTSVPAGSERGGRPRRVVSVTPAGLAELRKSRDALMRLWEGLESALEMP